MMNIQPSMERRQMVLLIACNFQNSIYRISPKFKIASTNRSIDSNRKINEKVLKR